MRAIFYILDPNDRRFIAGPYEGTKSESGEYEPPKEALEVMERQGKYRELNSGNLGWPWTSQHRAHPFVLCAGLLFTQ